MAYISRLYVRGVLQLLLATVLLHGLLGYLTPLSEQYEYSGQYYEDLHAMLLSLRSPHTLEQARLKAITAYFHLSKPWPQNYLTWLFDTEASATNKMQNVQPSYVTIPGTEIKGHGILTGDLGYSMQVDRGRPTMNVILGEEPWMLPLLAMTATLGLSLLTLLRMRERGLAYAVPSSNVVNTYMDDCTASAAFLCAYRGAH